MAVHCNAHRTALGTSAGNCLISLTDIEYNGALTAHSEDPFGKVPNWNDLAMHVTSDGRYNRIRVTRNTWWK